MKMQGFSQKSEAPNCRVNSVCKRATVGSAVESGKSRMNECAEVEGSIDRSRDGLRVKAVGATTIRIRSSAVGVNSPVGFLLLCVRRP